MEAERKALMRLVQAHTDDVEVNNMIKSTAETLIEKGFEQAKAEIYGAWDADWEKRRQAEAEKG